MKINCAGLAVPRRSRRASGRWSCQGSRDRMEPITVDEIAAHIRYLSSDQLEGRAVGTQGHRAGRPLSRGLFPDDGPRARLRNELPPDVPAEGLAARSAGVARDQRARASPSRPSLWDEFVIRTEREDAPAEASGELVYCGYLVQAPERSWDDIKGVDLTGKVLLVEVNEPGNRPGGVFDGEDMTYYGRWPYKYEKATELGAAGVLIIHDTKGAAYGWDVLRASWGNESFFVPDREPPAPLRGLDRAARRPTASWPRPSSTARPCATRPRRRTSPPSRSASRRRSASTASSGPSTASTSPASSGPSIPPRRSGRSSSRPTTIISARTRRSRATRSTTGRSTTARPRPPCWPPPGYYAQRPGQAQGRPLLRRRDRRGAARPRLGLFRPAPAVPQGRRPSPTSTSR